MARRDVFGPYVPVATQRKRAQREVRRLRKRGKTIEPVEVEGRAIARSFWGKSWCEHLESYSDFENRLPRGRTYVRNGSVCHLSIDAGRVGAIVSGSALYEVDIRIAKLPSRRWKDIERRCAGQVGSVLELLQGRLSEHVMAVVTDRDAGLFPSPREIALECSCPDYARLCKHLAAVLYGVGHRLDSRPELLFTLRGVDAQDLIAAEPSLPAAAPSTSGETLSDDELGDIFGIELDAGEPAPAAADAPGASPRAPDPDPDPGATPAPRRRANKRANRGAEGDEGDEALPRLRPSGKSVARLRRKAGWTVAELAEQLDVTPATVHRWEATPGRLRLRPASYRALARLHRRLWGR